MKFFLPRDLTFHDTNIAENEAEDGSTYQLYNPLLGYNIGSIRKYGTNIYEALTIIYPLVTYIWEDAIITDKHAVRMSDGVALYPTAGILNIAITAGVTTFYVRSSGNYYIAKTTGTVDIMVESEPAPSNFDKVVAPAPYRYQYNYPEGESDNLFWGYNGKANRYKSLDRAVGTQSVKYGSNTYTASFDINSVNAVSLFYIDGLSVNCTVYDIINPLTPIEIYNSTKDLTDVSKLDNYEKVCTVPYSLGVTASFVFDARYAMRVVITITNTLSTPKVGAIKIGRLDYLGQTLDGVSIGGKSYNRSEQRSNGEIVWNKDNKESNKVNTLSYNVKIDTETVDAVTNLVNSILDKEVVLLGDDGDANGYTTLTNYGAITNHSGTLMSNSTKSQISLTIENFT